jgi:hypothetical protein
MGQDFEAALLERLSDPRESVRFHRSQMGGFAA